MNTTCTPRYARVSSIRQSVRSALLLTTAAIVLTGCSDDSTPTVAAPSTATISDAPVAATPPSNPTEVIDIWTPAAVGEISTLKRRLAECGDPNALDPTFGVSAIEFAADFGRTEAIRAILDAGGDVNARSKDRGSALLGAAFFGRPDCVRLLLEAGADPRIVDKNGTNPTTALDVPWEYTQPIIEFLQMSLDREDVEQGRAACRPLIKASLR